MLETYYLHKKPAARSIIMVNHLHGMAPYSSIGRNVEADGYSPFYPDDRGNTHSITLEIQVAR